MRAGSEGVRRAPDARLSSETPDAMIDRLSILALKSHHMGLQAQRQETGNEHLRGVPFEARGQSWRSESLLKVYREFKTYKLER